MDNASFNEVVKWSQERGMKIFPQMERKAVNGINGMYATTNIPKNTLLLSFPLKNLLTPDPGFRYPKGMNDSLKYGHRAALEYIKGEQSEWHGVLRSLESLESLQQTSAYFLHPKELEAIQAMSPMLHRIIGERNETITQQIEQLCQLDPTINKQVATTIALNLKTRSWKQGFLPIFDQFNHSDAYGAKVSIVGDHLCFFTLMNYRAGDQIWISYGLRDIYDYAIDYDFFDPKGVHAISFAIRGSQVTNNDFDTAVIRYAATKHKIGMDKTPEGLFYQLEEDNAMFLEHAPSSRLIEYIQNTAFSTKEEFKAKRCSAASFDLRINQILDALLASNRVEQVRMENIPPRLQRFQSLLRKEKQILINNKIWARFNSAQANEVDQKIIQAIKF